jgi:phosphocarrier protein
MISRNVTIQNSVGLHARPATFFVQKANSFKCSIWVEKEDCRVNAKSLLGVLSLGITRGMTITLIADGEDEAAAIEGLATLVDTELCDNKQFIVRKVPLGGELSRGDLALGWLHRPLFFLERLIGLSFGDHSSLILEFYIRWTFG